MRLWERIFSAIYDPLLWIGERTGMSKRRGRLLAQAEGRVLEIGAGTGLNLNHYPDSLTELVLTEPAAPMASRLERRAERSALPTRVVTASAEALPFEDDSFDTVVSTLVLCTVDDPERTLAEIARVLRPDGQLLFIEHVRARSPRLAGWQDRLARPWLHFAAGCRCNRATLDLLRSGGFAVSAEDAVWRGMPAIVGPLAVGRATR